VELSHRAHDRDYFITLVQMKSQDTDV
jgi:hypothetical protein